MAWTKTNTPAFRPTDGGQQAIVVLSEEAINDSDKSLVITDELGAKAVLRIDGLRVEFIASATAGTRLMRVNILEGADILYTNTFSTNSDVTANVTNVMEAGIDNPSAAPVAGVSQEPWPSSLFVRAGMTIQVLDSAAIDAAADDMQVHIRGTLIAA